MGEICICVGVGVGAGTVHMMVKVSLYCWACVLGKGRTWVGGCRGCIWVYKWIWVKGIVHVIVCMVCVH